MKSTNSSSTPARTKAMQQIRLPLGKEKMQKTHQRIFKNRWSTLKRKAKHLATLCNGQVCMVMSGSNGNLEVWPNPPAAIEAIILKYLEAHNKRSFMRKKLELNLSDFPEIQKTGAVDTGNHNDEEFDKFLGDSLIDLSVFLKSKVQKLDKAIRSTEVSVNPTCMNQANGYLRTAESFVQIPENYSNNFPSWEFSNCHNNPYEGIYGTTATSTNSGQSVTSNVSSIGFEAVENTMYQQRTQNINGFGETDLSHLNHHQQQFMGVPQSHPYDEVPISLWSYRT